jgi:hypothetical protein
MQGGKSINPHINLIDHLTIDKDKAKIFWQLWNIIGKNDEAPFYVNGPTYFNTISPYIKGLPPTYSKYIE